VKLSRREKFLLVLLLLVIIGAAYYSLYYKPFSENLMKVQTEINEKKERISSYQMKKAVLPKLKENIEKLEKELDDYYKENNIDSRYNAAVIIVYLEELLGRHNAEQRLIELSEPVNGQHYNSADIEVIFRADYEKAKQIINELESGMYKQFISEISIEEYTGGSEEDGQDSGTLVVTVKFTHIFDSPGGSDEDYPFMKDGKFGKDNLFS